MGHGSSVPQKTVEWAVVNTEMKDGRKRLSRDTKFRCSFVEYIKSSTWLDELADNHFCQEMPRTRKIMNGAISTYQMTMGKLMEVEGVILSSSLKSFVRSFSNPVTPRAAAVKTESYFNVESSTCFEDYEYLALLFQIMYPAFLDSDEYQRFLKYGIERGASDLDLEDGETVSLFSASLEVLVPCPQSVRLQEILLGCAAHFDESFQLTRLLEPEWTDDLTNGLLHHSHAITVMDGAHILYSNKAFQDMTVQSEEDLRHADLSILNGPDTEVSQLLLLDQAMQPKHSAKFAITFYTKNKRSFTDLIAVKTTTGYSVAVHFPAVQGANLEKLKEVDDLLILVSQIVKSTAPRPATATPRPNISLLPALLKLVTTAAFTVVPPAGEPEFAPLLQHTPETTEVSEFELAEEPAAEPVCAGTGELMVLTLPSKLVASIKPPNSCSILPASVSA